MIPRALNDLDIVVDSFDSIPPTIAHKDLLLRHIHPKAPRGKILLQLVDPEVALRIDIFRSFGATLSRSEAVRFGVNTIHVVSVEDLAARSASLVLGLERGTPVPQKHAKDFQRLVRASNPETIEIVWRDHRKESDPPTFHEASLRVRELIRERNDLLVTPRYSRDVDAVCPNCEEVGPFRLASPLRILSILGYC